MGNKKYKISLFNNYFDNVPKQKELDFDGILQLFRESSIEDIKEKKQLKGIICGSFNKISKRTTNNLLCRTIIAYDIDNYNSNINVLTKYIQENLKNYTYIYYSTISSTYDKPRVRIFLFPNEDILVQEYGNIAENIIVKILPNLSKYIDISSYKPNQLMFLPLCKDTNFVCHKNIGELIDISKYKEVIKNKKDKENSYTDEIKEFVKTTVNNPLELDDETIYKTLEKYDPTKTDYYEWFRVCQALHHQYKGELKGLNIFYQWSLSDDRVGNEYKAEDIKKECIQKYKSLTLKHDNPITFASIIKIVNEQYVNQNKLKKENNEQIVQAMNPSLFVHFKTTKQLTPKSTYENFKIMCDYYNIKINYDVITKGTINSFDEDNLNILQATLKSLMNLNNMSVGEVSAYVLKMENENKINSFKNILDNIIWDGRSRINDFFNTLTVKPIYEEIRNIYLLKWLQQTIYLSLEENKTKIARNILVLKGKQGIGKTTWIKSLLPENIREKYIGEGMMLNVNDNNSVLACIKYLFVELAELEQSFSKTDINQFKSFFGRNKDVLNIKYLAYPTIYPRTTTFIGTVNDDVFLKDDTGSNRFLVLPIESVNIDKDLDMLQLFKEIYENTDYLNFELDKSQLELQYDLNQDFEQPNLLEEQFIEEFEIDLNKIIDGEYLNCTQILEQIGYNKHSINQMHRLQLGKILRKYEFPYRKNCKKWQVKTIKQK